MRKIQAGRLFAVGDIHGCLENLTKLMTRLPLDKKRDSIVFLGDYINRGPDSRGVLEYLVEVRRTIPGAVFLMGNHEHMLLEYARTHDLALLRSLRAVGVDALLASYGARTHALRSLSFLPPEHLDFLHNLSLCHTALGHRFVHADVHRGQNDLCFAEQQLYSRRMVQGEPLDGLPVVFGHTPFDTPLVTPDRIGLDTGAVYGNVLTALELPSRIFYHA